MSHPNRRGGHSTTRSSSLNPEAAEQDPPLGVDLDVLRAGREDIRLDLVRQGGPYGVLDELVLDLHPRAVRCSGIGHLESQRLIHLGVKALEAEAREVADRPAPELNVDEVGRGWEERAPSAHVRLWLAIPVDRLVVLLAVVHDLQVRAEAQFVQDLDDVPRERRPPRR